MLSSLDQCLSFSLVSLLRVIQGLGHAGDTQEGAPRAARASFLRSVAALRIGYRMADKLSGKPHLWHPFRLFRQKSLKIWSRPCWRNPE